MTAKQRHRYGRATLLDTPLSNAYIDPGNTDLLNDRATEASKQCFQSMLQTTCNFNVITGPNRAVVSNEVASCNNTEGVDRSCQLETHMHM